MKRPTDPVHRPGRFVEQLVINGVTLPLWCKPQGCGGDAVWTAVLDRAPHPWTTVHIADSERSARAALNGIVAATACAEQTENAVASQWPPTVRHSHWPGFCIQWHTNPPAVAGKRRAPSMRGFPWHRSAWRLATPCALHSWARRTAHATGATTAN